jgi:hypothetical protein
MTNPGVKPCFKQRDVGRAMVEAVRSELCSWPRASSEVRLELCSC